MSKLESLELKPLEELLVDTKVELAASIASPVFQNNGWTWHDKGVPTCAAIEEHIEGLVVGLMKDEEAGTIHCGRLLVTGDKKELHICLVLSSIDMT